MRSVIGVGLVATGVVVLVGCALSVLSTRAYLGRAHKAQGTVVRLDAETDADGGRSFRPVVRYRPEAGKAEVEFSSRLLSNPSPYSAGDVVTVLHEPGRADGAEIEGFFELWLVSLLCGVVGMVFLAVGAGVHWRRPRALFGPDAAGAESA